MFKKIFSIIVLLFIFFVIPNIVRASFEEEILIKYRSLKTTEEVAKKYGIKSDDVKKIDKINLFKLKKISFLNKLKISWDKYLENEIEYTEPNYEYRTSVIPNDTYFEEQWALEKINAPDAWDKVLSPESVTVGVLDTGIKGDHEDLIGKVSAGYDFIGDEDILPDTDSDNNGHGTAVAGVIGAIANNNIGIAGLDWSTSIMPVKVLDEEGVGNTFDIVLGIIYAVDNGAKVLNLSFGGSGASKILEDIINYAYEEKGVLVVAASGNGNSSIDEPARYEKVIAVGSVDEQDSRSNFSNYGPELDLVAPGEQIATTYDDPEGDYAYISGTSLASPYVSGLISMIWSVYPEMTNDEIFARIKNNTDKPLAMGDSYFNNEYGNGRINADFALNNSYVDPRGTNYQSQFIFQSPYPTVSDGQTAAMTVAYKNTGTATWRKGTVNLGTVDSSFNWKLGGYDLSYNWLSSNRPTSLDQDTVAPGEIGTFTFQIKNNGASQGNHRLDVGLVAEGITWFGSNTHAYWDVNVPVNYSAQFVSQSNYVTINEGETKSMTISYRNTGSSVWRKGTVNLGTVDSSFNWKLGGYDLSYNWLSSNRPTSLDQDTVAPGEIGTFTFQIKNNGASQGNHRLDVGLVAEGITWFGSNTHAYWDVNVPVNYSAQFVSQSNYVTINEGETKSMTISYRNTGSSVWRKGTVNLGTVDSSFNWKLGGYDLSYNWLSSNRPTSLDQDTVAPGEIGTFTFQIKNNGASQGNHRLDVGLVAEGITWFGSNTHAYWDVYVL